MKKTFALLSVVLAFAGVATAVWGQSSLQDQGTGSAAWSVEAVSANIASNSTPNANAIPKTDAAPGTDSIVEVVFTARVTPGWHIYDLGPFDIPSIATSFDFSGSEGLELVGETMQSGTPVRKFDKVLEIETSYFEGLARFSQKVRVLRPGATIAGEVEYQLCNDAVGCIRNTWDFSLKVADGESVSTAPPAETDKTDNSQNGFGSMWSMILGAILWGFAALLTPCVFPMVPMTVSFFMKGDEGKSEGKSDGDSKKSQKGKSHGKLRALAFGGFIVGLYTLPIAVIILITYFAGGDAVTADIFNWLSTHWIPNVLFFLVFMAFAASLLGAFEMRMPSRLVNRSDRGAEKGGLAGTFFLAMTLVLVSFSCTGPIVGTVLIESTQGAFWAPIVTMLCFSVAFALPFTLLAFFPRLMQKLPKSGGWLDSVKVILGLVEIALGLKFLSVADQTYHWGILDREVYLAIWIVVFALLGFYLLGKLRFRHSPAVEHIGVGRLALAIVVFSFVVWLIPGMWGAPLKAISGYLPPVSSQDFVVGRNSDGTGNPTAYRQTDEKIKYADALRLPHGMTGYFDFEQGMARAREEDKPVFLDFTGHGCVNCREMEERVWVSDEVQAILRENYIVVALYSDDRTSLPEADRITTSGGKTLKTLGRKNSYLVNTRYKISSQPAYLVLDGNGELLLPAYGYNLSIPDFVEFLQKGIAAYSNLSAN